MSRNIILFLLVVAQGIACYLKDRKDEEYSAFLKAEAALNDMLYDIRHMKNDSEAPYWEAIKDIKKEIKDSIESLDNDNEN